MEINGITVYRSRIDHRAMENTGGTSVFLSPGLQYIGGRRWLIEASFQYPVINRPNGTQLAVDWNLSIGSRILLF